jgi:hypothetical protein
MTKALFIGIVAVASAAAVSSAAAQGVSGWEIGPVIRGKNYSAGVPSEPTATRDGWALNFPYPSARAGHVNAVSVYHGSLAGKSRIVVRYRVDAERGARFMPKEYSPGWPATVSLSFQRAGDTWSGKGRYEHYRWYAPAGSIRELKPGVQEMTVSLDDGDWVSVLGQTAAANPRAFAEAKADAERISLAFGSGAARGHGVYATAPARFTLLGFEVS